MVRGGFGQSSVSISQGIYSRGVFQTDHFNSVGYITAASAIYHSLQIPLPFLQGGRSDGYKPESILVCISTPVLILLGLADICPTGFGRKLRCRVCCHSTSSARASGRHHPRHQLSQTPRARLVSWSDGSHQLSIGQSRRRNQESVTNRRRRRGYPRRCQRRAN